VLYSLMAGQEAAPQFSAKWMRGSTGLTTCKAQPTTLPTDGTL
jgi:hypothetical protein